MTKAIRVPPHDLSAEQAVLSSLLNGDASVDTVSGIISASDFYSPGHRRVYEAIESLRNTSEPIDGVTVAGWLKARDRLVEVGGHPAIVALLDGVASTTHVEAYARAILASSRRRAMIQAAQRVIDDGYSPEGADEGYLERSASALASVVGSRKASGVSDFEEEARAFLEELAHSAQTGRRLGLSTGFESLNVATSGMHRKEVSVIAGRPGSGKSALVLGMAVEAAKADGDEVTASFIVSAEMSPRMLVARAICTQAEVSLTAARSGVLYPADWSRLQDAVQWSHEFPVRLIDRMRSITELRSALREYQAHLARMRSPDGRPIRLGMVAVDYMQLVASTLGARGRNESQEEQISNLALGLQSLAKELDVAMILLSQLNRDVEKRPDRRPVISDLKGSGAIEAVADLILLLYRDEYYNPGTLAKGIAEIIVGKQRSGATGKILMGFDSRLTRFHDLSEEKTLDFAYLLEEK